MKYSFDRSETMKIWNNEKVYFITLQTLKSDRELPELSKH